MEPVNFVQKPPLTAPRLLRHSEAHSFTLDQFDFETPIDRTRFYICPTLTPLYYTACFRKLTADQSLRYNQITALCFGEMIAFFEHSFEQALHALLRSCGDCALGSELRQCVEHFIAEETKHREMWRRLAKLSEPVWYDKKPRRIIKIGRGVQSVLGLFTQRPQWFPTVIWIMLALEEHSMEISRRCGKMPADQIEARYAAVYRAHMEEEVRHVQIDWHLLLHLMQGMRPQLRRMNGWLFRQAMSSFFFRPTRAAVRVIDQLIKEHPEVAAIRSSALLQLSQLENDAEFRRMMFSPDSTPITFALMEQFVELKVAS